jgi:putative oxidoreductase
MNRTLGDVGLLLLRMAGVGLAVAHGIPKLARMLGGNLGFVDSVARLGFPFPAVFAWAAALSESVGGLLLAVGLGTRVTAAFCACTMAVAAFLRHHAHDLLRINLGLLQADPATVEKWGDPELALVYLLAFLALCMLGGGRFALERAFRRGGARR